MPQQHFNYKLSLFFIMPILFAIALFAIVNTFFQSRDKINIILIMVDALRSDHLGCYGYHRNTSFNIDSLAKNSTLYLNCFSPTSRTITSSYSLLTSLYPIQHKVDGWGSILSNDVPNIISVLHNHGYSIGIFGNQDLLLRNVKKNFGHILDGYENNSEVSVVTKDALEWMKSQRSPFFLWIYYLDPHRPYTPSSAHNNLYSYKSDVVLPIKKVVADNQGGWDYIPEVIAENGIGNPNYYIAKYDEEINDTDEKIGDLLKGLEKMGLLNRSLVIFTSDHGESLGEHHLYFNHLWTVFNEVIKIPLLIKRPRQIKGNVVEENVSTIDIFPTILKEIGVRKYMHTEGMSLGHKRHKPRAIFSYANNDIHCLIYGRWKLIKYPLYADYIKMFFPEYPAQKYQLFNIQDDSKELVNLAKINKVEYQKLKHMMAEWEYRMELFISKSNTFELDEDYKKRLRSLGYAQ